MPYFETGKLEKRVEMFCNTFGVQIRPTETIDAIAAQSGFDSLFTLERSLA